MIKQHLVGADKADALAFCALIAQHSKARPLHQAFVYPLCAAAHIVVAHHCQLVGGADVRQSLYHLFRVSLVLAVIVEQIPQEHHHIGLLPVDLFHPPGQVFRRGIQPHMGVAKADQGDILFQGALGQVMLFHLEPAGLDPPGIGQGHCPQQHQAKGQAAQSF